MRKQVEYPQKNCSTEKDTDNVSFLADKMDACRLGSFSVPSSRVDINVFK